MDAKKRNILLKWGASYTADKLDGSYKIRVSTLDNKGLTKWAIVVNNWWKKVEHFAKAASLAKDQCKGPKRDHGGKRPNRRTRSLDGNMDIGAKRKPLGSRWQFKYSTIKLETRFWFKATLSDLT
ncbi:hypothetical protein AXG93_1903s1000 [Marchantia polymorpha subsp. ruderalis]|uniref:Uncharacterized protein n=1 Tax=Marchantia polymorpha subsp. ruderalis TaxID=1480154 RepID=A0A176VM85_MARPO|nr:hypothetical protein AXG93_1903s1000 [Marchantia polymorpha subsp. ruderalis]